LAPWTRADRLATLVKKSIGVQLSELSLKALKAGGGSVRDDIAPSLERAVRVYLADGGLDKPGWSCPETLREASAGDVELELSFDVELWRALNEEARRQGVSASRLVGHAALYYAAELDAGRIAQRILDAAEAEDAEA
jgi:hypothetical protein